MNYNLKTLDDPENFVYMDYWGGGGGGGGFHCQQTEMDIGFGFSLKVIMH